MDARRPQRQRSAVSRVGDEGCPGEEAFLGRIGVHLHRHFTFEPVSLADSCDDNFIHASILTGHAHGFVVPAGRGDSYYGWGRTHTEERT
ncbi:hypothetical protein GCM10009763_09210 [Dermacoccus profundi]|uniref:Uncharacterized protein n=1 Tax=Dermacoccus profundi TaxID=322602 RepID=A0ABN2CT23_9MICO